MARRFDGKAEETEEDRRRRVQASFRCAVPRCPRSGAISGNTRGAGPWYCREHWRDPPTNPLSDEEVRMLKGQKDLPDLLGWALQNMKERKGSKPRG